MSFLFPIHPRRQLVQSTVVALHCSGASGGQWRGLREELDAAFDVVTPEHYGCESRGPWSGQHAFTLADEAVPTLELIDRSGEPVHLVGHSYGGAVALHAALVRKDKIASLTLYEPSAFHLLPGMGERGRTGHVEITEVADFVRDHVAKGDRRAACAKFVDYWNGGGSWNAMRADKQAALVQWAGKAPLDFHALLNEPTGIEDYASLEFPVLLMRGEHAPASTRLIADLLAETLPDARLSTIAGAGHMGPFTHADMVNAETAKHLAFANERGDPRAARARTVRMPGVVGRPVLELAS